MVVIDHRPPGLDKYPLISAPLKKRVDFELFKLAILSIKNKEHLTKEGLNKLISIRASMNKGLTDELKAAFPGITPINKPNIETNLAFFRILNDWQVLRTLPLACSPPHIWGGQRQEKDVLVLL